MTRSNEVESLAEVLRMIGGSDDFISSILVAGFIQTFKESVSVYVWTAEDRGKNAECIEVDVWRMDEDKNGYGPLIQLIVPKKYKYLFEESEDENNSQI